MSPFTFSFTYHGLGGQAVLEVESFAESQGRAPISNAARIELAQAVGANANSGQPHQAADCRPEARERSVNVSVDVFGDSNPCTAQEAGTQLRLEATMERMRVSLGIRTSHVLSGGTIATALSQAPSAGRALSNAARAMDKSAMVAGGQMASRVVKVAGPVGAIVDAGFRVKGGLAIEKQYQAGLITERERAVEHAANAAGMVGGWACALAGAKLGGMTGGGAGSCVAPGPGTAVGGVAGALVGGIAGYFGGEAVATSAAAWSVNKMPALGTSV